VTIASTSGSELTIGQHIQLAYQTLGVLHASQEPSEDQYTLGKRHLQNLLNGLKRYGILAHAVEPTTIAIVADQATYDLPDGTIDLYGTAMWAPTGDDGNGKLPVTPVTFEEWQRMSAKGSTGVPTRYWVDRSARELNLWLIPSEAGTLEIQARRKLADVTDRTNTLDLEQVWDEWVNAALAAKLAPAMSQWDKAPRFDQQAQYLLEMTRATAAEQRQNQPMLRHKVRI